MGYQRPMKRDYGRVPATDRLLITMNRRRSPRSLFILSTSRIPDNPTHFPVASLPPKSVLSGENDACNLLLQRSYPTGKENRWMDIMSIT